MLDPEEIRWVKSTANELNNLLQVITDSSQVLEGLCAGNTQTESYFAILRNGVDRAAKVTRMMVDRVGGTAAPDSPATPAPPVVPARTDTEENASENGVQIHNPKGTREMVMIVDDEDFVTMLAEKVLAGEGYRVVTAKDGFEAIDIYRKLGDRISLIILDFTMPLMDGSDVFTELLDINPKVPVVLSSGFAEQDRLRGMLARGLRGFIPKPYTQDRLLTEVRTTLDTIVAEGRGK
jgi:CheY-like chemotaxis protein